MRIRWRGLELPGRVIREDDVSTPSYGRFIVEPFERGFGTTIGNSLRRVLLSSLEGAAVTSVKIAGVAHEFCSIEGIMEDVTDIILNIKGIVVHFEGKGPKTISLKRDKAGDVKAGDLICDASVTILNPDHVIATLTRDVQFRAEMIVDRGRGFQTASDHRDPDQEIGMIPMDAVFSPVTRVRYRTEDMRVGQLTNYDRLILEIWTNGTIRPEDALVEAGLILRKHLNPLVMYNELGPDLVSSGLAHSDGAPPMMDAAMEEKLNRPIASLNLSVRASNCLEAARVATIRDLVSLTEGDLLRIRSFGKTSLHEVTHKLSEMNLTLGMKVGGRGFVPSYMSSDNLVGIDEIASEEGAEATGGNSAGPMAAFTMGD